MPHPGPPASNPKSIQGLMFAVIYSLCYQTIVHLVAGVCW